MTLTLEPAPVRDPVRAPPRATRGPDSRRSETITVGVVVFSVLGLFVALAWGIAIPHLECAQKCTPHAAEVHGGECYCVLPTHRQRKDP